MPTVEELKAALAAAEQEQRVISNSTRQAAVDKYAPSSWGSNEYDFTTPSGQTCRMRRLPIEELAKSGIIDKITRLPGLAGELVNRAGGAPPEDAPMPSKETISVLTEVVNQLLPIVVVAPKVWPVPQIAVERTEGRIYVDSIDFADRIAILNKATAGLVDFDSFRQ